MPRSFALVVLLALLWGAAFPLLKIAVETIPPLTVTAVRSVLGCLLLFAFLGREGLAQVRRIATTGTAFLTQGLFNCILPWLLVSWASQSIDAGLATILNSLSPIFIFLLTWAVTRHEPATPRKFAGVVLGLAGVVVIVGLDALAGIGRQTLAQVACVAGSFCYAVAAIIGRRFDNVSALVPAAGSTLVAAAVLTPLALWIDEPWKLAPSMRSMMGVAGLAVLSTGLAFIVYFRLLATVGSIATSAQAYLRILVGVGLGIAFLGEKLSTSVALGLPLVIAGVIAMTVNPRREKAARS